MAITISDSAVRPTGVGQLVRITDPKAYVCVLLEIDPETGKNRTVPVPVGTLGLVQTTDPVGGLVHWEGWPPAWVRWDYMERAPFLESQGYRWRHSWRPGLASWLRTPGTWGQAANVVVGGAAAAYFATTVWGGTPRGDVLAASAGALGLLATAGVQRLLRRLLPPPNQYAVANRLLRQRRR